MLCGSAAGCGYRGTRWWYRVGGEVWDLTRPLEGDCTLEYCSFDTPDGREVRLPVHMTQGLGHTAYTPLGICSFEGEYGVRLV